MNGVVTWSKDPIRQPRHVLAVVQNGAVLLRSTPLSVADSDLQRRLVELQAVDTEERLHRWVRSQGLSVGFTALEGADETWFERTIPGDAHFVYDVRLEFPARPPEDWKDRVRGMLLPFRATMDSETTGGNWVHFLVRRPIVEPMAPHEVQSMRLMLQAGFSESRR